MTVTSTSLGTGVTRALVDQSTRLSAILNNSNVAPTQSKSVDTSAAVQVDDDPNPDDSTVTLRVQSVTVSYASTKLDTLDTGATQVLRILGQLQSLASRATLPGLSESERSILNGQFQALKVAINNVPPAPPGSSFTPSQVLGTLAGDVSTEDQDATLGGFSVSNLLGDDTDLSSEDAANSAVQVINDAITKIAAQLETIGNLKGVTDFAAANIDGALQNQEAASATLDDNDASLVAALQANAANTQAAQTTRLPNNILQLLAQ